MQDQEAYHLRQLYLYNCTLVNGNLNLTRNTGLFTTGLKTNTKKVQMKLQVSCFNFLSQTNFPNNQSTVRQVVDGCGGQNKNRVIFLMRCVWLLKNAPENLKLVGLIFPVRVHSSDRVFGNIEQDLRRHKVIDNPEKYLEIIKYHATVL